MHSHLGRNQVKYFSNHATRPDVHPVLGQPWRVCNLLETKKAVSSFSSLGSSFFFTMALLWTRVDQTASQACDRRPLPAPPASLWGDHIPLHPRLSPTFSYNHLPRSKRDTGCRAWEITPIERMVLQMVLDNAPSPPPSTFRALT